jgi:6-phosphogluconolactonase
MNKINIFESENDLAEKFCIEFFKMADEQIAFGKFFNVALSGGNTPSIVFRKIADDFQYRIDWRGVRFFWSDERCVPPGDPQSNYGSAKKLLFDRIPVPEENIFRISGEMEPDEEAERYSEQLVKLGIHHFDLAILGLGEDGHIASIFRNDLALFNSRELFTTTYHPETLRIRITATGSLINRSKRIILLVAGSRKSSILDKIIGKRDDYLNYPAANVDSGRSEWFVDSSAANLLNRQKQ